VRSSAGESGKVGNVRAGDALKAGFGLSIVMVFSLRFGIHIKTIHITKSHYLRCNINQKSPPQGRLFESLIARYISAPVLFLYEISDQWEFNVISLVCLNSQENIKEKTKCTDARPDDDEAKND
jgi:hypothetical protein